MEPSQEVVEKILRALLAPGWKNVGLLKFWHFILIHNNQHQGVEVESKQILGGAAK